MKELRRETGLFFYCADGCVALKNYGSIVFNGKRKTLAANYEFTRIFLLQSAKISDIVPVG